MEAAVKGRSPLEIREVIAAGIRIVGESYVQEARAAFAVVGHAAQWHMIGHLQRNKVRHAVELFSMIETVDSIKLAGEIDRRCAAIGRTMPVLVEVNSGREPQKYGVVPEAVAELIERMSRLEHVTVEGLMTMGPRYGDPELARPFFQETTRLFDELKCMEDVRVRMRYLSMGMSNTYRVAIEEGANIVRIGTKVFGERT